MVPQERPDPHHIHRGTIPSALDADKHPASSNTAMSPAHNHHHRSLLSATDAALNFAASFHRDAQTCRSTLERRRLHETYRDKILAVDGIAANVAAALLPLLSGTVQNSLQHHKDDNDDDDDDDEDEKDDYGMGTVTGTVTGTDNDNNPSRWSDFDRLAQRGRRMRDRESQHLQHRSGIIAAWGPECFGHYGWHALPLPLLRQLHDLAVLVPRWGDVVELLNAKMLARHELRVVGGRNKALRVGEHSPASKVQAAHSPVERSDILAALEWAQRGVKRAARRINGAPIREFGLKRDAFGMVVPLDECGTEDGNEDAVDDEDEDENEVDGDDEDAEGVEDDANDGHGLVGPLTRPTKRTRLSASSTRYGLSVSPDVKKSRGARCGRACGSHSPGSESEEPEETELLEQSEESGAETGDQAFGDGSGDSDRISAGASRRMEQGMDNVIHVVVGTTEQSILSDGPGDVQEARMGNTAGRGVRANTPGLASWPEDEETISVADEQPRDATSPEDTERGVESEEKSGGDESMASTAAKDGTEEETTRTSKSRDKHRCGLEDSDDGYQGDSGSPETAVAHPQGIQEEMTPRTIFPGPTPVSDAVTGQTRAGRPSALQGPANHPVADRTLASSLNTGATVSKLGHYLSPPLTGGSEGTGPTPVAPGSGPVSTGSNAPLPPPPPPPPPLQQKPQRQQQTILQTLQARHADTIRRLIRDLRRPHASEEVSRHRRLQLDWLGPERWARIYAAPDPCGRRLGPGCVSSPDEADVWYLTWASFREHAEAGGVFGRPVVVRQEFQDSGAYDVVDYVDMLWQRFPEKQVDVQDGATGATSSMSLVEYCLAVADVDLGSADAAAAISSVTNLRRLARADEPLLSRLPRFRLLSTLADRVAGTVGRGGGHPIMNDVQGCLGFDLLSFAGAFSGSYVDPLVGSWTRCLSGVQIVAVATDLDDADWRRFAREGRGWAPPGGVGGRLMVLEQDDVLFMPPGLRAVRATFAPEPCLMEGGMLWDECSIGEILEGLVWVVENRAYADDSIHMAFQLFPLVDALERWLDDENYVGRPSSEAAAAERYQTVKAGIRTLRALLRVTP
ncbi:hypothetical protein CSHISOI_01296 [Colletotrichum shisoi]|uniref:Uncharacterized protein n=1 Tax=Colletotrichum shisoi TaxID=2078593 RepID=A0A5Q4C5L6_9PEZI|nr:hypothetical protein CSHISOI_01296 [Colletotrichum shisoi]